MSKLKTEEILYSISGASYGVIMVGGLISVVFRLDGEKLFLVCVLIFFSILLYLLYQNSKNEDED